MTNTSSAARKKQAGFTLVELAVVMIIIGLLIGGVLKGQELIANAQVTATAASVKGIDAATTTFRDTFATLPGDMAGAGTRLPNCTAAPCINVGNGNGQIGAAGALAAAMVATGENVSFWAHLDAADLLSGINPGGGAVWGGLYPAAPIAGGFHAGFVAGGALGDTAGARQGHYLVLTRTAGAAPAGNALTALQAARIDRKLDDGQAQQGTVFSAGAALGGSTCDGGAGGLYNEAAAAVTCDLVLRFQN